MGFFVCRLLIFFVCLLLPPSGLFSICNCCPCLCLPGDNPIRRGPLGLLGSATATRSCCPGSYAGTACACAAAACACTGTACAGAACACTLLTNAFSTSLDILSCKRK